MPQLITNLGELGVAGAILRPLDLPLLRDGIAWDLTGYANEVIKVWDLRSRTEITSPGTVSILTPETDGVVRWVPANSSFSESGTYEAYIEMLGPSLEQEVSGKFRFSLGAPPQ